MQTYKFTIDYDILQTDIKWCVLWLSQYNKGECYLHQSRVFSLISNRAILDWCSEKPTYVDNKTDKFVKVA